MDYSLISPFAIADRFESLPEELQEALSEVASVETVRQICRSNYLQDEEKVLMMEQLVALVFLGFLLPDELAREISGNLHIHPKTAETVAQEIDQKIFSSFRDKLKKIYRPVQEEKPAQTLRVEVQKESADLGKIRLDAEGDDPRALRAAEKLKAASVQEKIRVLKEAALGGYAAQIPNLEDHLKENEFKLYNEEKTYQTIADQSGLSLKKLIKESKVQAGPAAGDELKEKISDYFKRVPAAGELDSFFRNPGLGKLLPLGLDAENIKELRGEIVRGSVANFSPQVLANFLMQLIKKSRLNNFSRAAKEVGLRKEDFSPTNLEWLDSQAARSLGVGRELFGLTDQR